jgi:hypothetical protein
MTMPSQSFASLFLAPALGLAVVLAETAAPTGWQLWPTPQAFADDDDDDDDDDDRPRFRYRAVPVSPGRGPRPRSRAPVDVDVLAREIVAFGVGPEALTQLRQERFTILGDRPRLVGSGRIVRLRPPGRMSLENALARVRDVAPGAAVDRNHLYRHGFSPQAGPSRQARPFQDPLGAVAWPKPETCAAPLRVGLIDTGVDPFHPALYGRGLVRETVRGPGLQASSNTHGTAVVTLLLGDGQRPGLLPNGDVIAVDAFHRRGRGDAADTFDLVSALDLLVLRGVGIVNLSLAGPANVALDRAGQAARERGVVIVAASGNEGPAAPPLYPAGYPWAVAVTALDEARQVYSRASRGAHLLLTAPGVSLALLDSRGRERLHSGTSFAAPFVTAAFALSGTREPRAGGAPALDSLTKAAADLGPPGRDETFGWGLLQASALCARTQSRAGNR